MYSTLRKDGDHMTATRRQLRLRLVDDDVSHLSDFGARMADVLEELLGLGAESNPMPMQMHQHLDWPGIIGDRGRNQHDRLSRCRLAGAQRFLCLGTPALH